MIPRFRAHQSGATAIEFAILSPIFLMILLGTMALGLGFWMKNALQETASDTARCIAIHAASCATAATGCDSSAPGICYFERTASRRGVSGIQASHVTIDRMASYGDVSFTTVTVTYPVDLLGYSYSITATGQFPNAV